MGKYYRPKVKLLTWWSAREPLWSSCIDEGIWIALSANYNKETGVRNYTFKCILHNNPKMVNQERTMNEVTVIQWCDRVTLKRKRYKSIADRKTM